LGPQNFEETTHEASVIDPDKPRGPHQCSICNQSFETSQAYGGHKSKKHPGSSLDYIAKAKIRAEREVDRDLHRAAKQRFKDENPTFIGKPPRGVLENIKYDIVLEPKSIFSKSTWYPRALERRDRALNCR